MDFDVTLDDREFILFSERIRHAPQFRRKIRQILRRASAGVDGKHDPDGLFPRAAGPIHEFRISGDPRTVRKLPSQQNARAFSFLPGQVITILFPSGCFRLTPVFLPRH